MGKHAGRISMRPVILTGAHVLLKAQSFTVWSWKRGGLSGALALQRRTFASKTNGSKRQKSTAMKNTARSRHSTSSLKRNGRGTLMLLPDLRTVLE